MMRVGGADAAHPGTVVGAIEPAHELRADATAHRASAFLAQALARNDEDEPEVTAGSAFEKLADGTFGPRQGHAVQIERRLGRKLAA